MVAPYRLAQPGGFQIMLMGFNMTVPMVIWMSYRGHPRVHSTEMAASMVVLTLPASILAWAGALETAAGLGVQHAAMIPAMLLTDTCPVTPYRRLRWRRVNRRATRSIQSSISRER